MAELLPRADILDVFQTLPRVPVGGDLASLSGYRGSLAEDLAAQKRARRKRSGQWRLKRGIDIYKLYKTFLAERGATHLLTSNIETPDAKIAIAAAQELGLGVMSPVALRNLTGTYFSPDSYETPPAYAATNPAARAHALEFVRRFRDDPIPARPPLRSEPSPDDPTLLPRHLPTLSKRIRGFIAHAIERPDLFDHDMIRVSVLNNFALLRKAMRGMRERRNASQFDVANVGELPPRFIFYPLQYTPESSINTPAPYFVDQFRVADAIRYAMPSDCVLVVKEHPYCLEVRPIDFMRRLRDLPGVVVAKASISSINLIKRAALTATVTGTAAFEAFLLGRPSLSLGPGLPAWALSRSTTIGNLRSEILQAIANPPSDEFVIDQVAKLINVSYPFYFGTAHSPGEPMLRRDNIAGFFAALTDHLRRESSAG
jgi:hypothetical protein